MSTPNPDDDDQAMRDALQRDATRVSEPAFDPALHHATMRRIRALTEPASLAARFHPRPALATAAAVLALIAFLVLGRPPFSSKVESPAVAALAPAAAAPRASLLAYQVAASAGDEALWAALDRDARELLPPSSPVFTATLH